MGKTETIHDRRFYNSWDVSVGSGLDGRDRRTLRDRAKHCEWEKRILALPCLG